MRSVQKVMVPLVVLILVAATAGWSQDGKAGQLFIMDLGARATGMGGAQVAVADDLAAARYNPAGLSSLAFRSVSVMRADMSLDRTQTVAQAVLPLQTFHHSVVSLSFLRFGIDDILCFDSDGNPCGSQPGDNRSPMIEDKEQMIWASYARNISARASVGFNVKFFKQTICTAGTDGIGIDLGFLYRMPAFVKPLNQVNVGLLIQDPEKMTLRWKGHNCALEDVVPGEGEFIDPDNDGKGFRVVKGVDQVPINYRLGTAFFLFDGKGTLAFDWDKRSDFHLGGEYWIADVIGLRLGFNSSFEKLTAGGSVRFGNILQQYQLDFAFERDDVLGNNTQATLTLRF